CINIHRFPAGGRNFESYGEDPFLSGRLAVSYIKALQAHHVIASVKHFALNNQEWRRIEIDVQASERAMREIYLPAFEAAVKEGGAYTVMSAYNKVNGWWCSENEHLLSDILKKEWGFQGLVVSDWVSTHSIIEATKNGLDLEMPDPKVFSIENLKRCIGEGKVSQLKIDEKVRRILRVKFMAGLFDDTIKADTAVLTGNPHKKLALEMAENGIVLLKNERGFLPLDINKIRKIAVIGPNANIARTGGGGSSHVDPNYSVSPLEGIKNYVGNQIQVVFAQGDELRFTPLNAIGSKYLKPGKEGVGLKADYYSNPALGGAPVLSRVDSSVNFNWKTHGPATELQKDSFSVRWTGLLIPPVTRKYTLYTASDDGVRLYIDDKMVIKNWTNHGTTIDSTVIEMTAGKAYNITLEYYEKAGDAVMIFGWDLPAPKVPNRHLADAVKAASSADIAIVCAGTSDAFESEGFDRIGGLFLPGYQDELIRAVVQANPRTIVVLNTGTPVIAENWLQKVPALLEAFFPGQEGGNALANILFGKVNPSGKLPFSFITGYDQTPAYKGYMDNSLVAPYSEGIFVGYRYLEKNQLKPAYPFGFGLSYTSFEYSGLEVKATTNGNFEVHLKVRNSGAREGREVVQLYVSDDHSKVERPVKELKGFSSLTLKPGEEKEVTMPLNSRSFAYYDEAGKNWKVDPGNFGILVGSSSADIKLKTSLEVK
ncbi:MAG: glycoside hydrolase family 3 C-terminal domain-containing protein, partial [Bacteroidota bacterium]